MAESVNITIDKSLVFGETDTEIKTRVPQTFGDNIKFLWLKKSNVEEINNGKTLLSSINPDNLYSLYDRNNNESALLFGSNLLSHYDRVDEKSVNIPREEQSKDKSVPADEAPAQTSAENNKTNVKRFEKQTSEKTEGTEITIPIIASIYDKSVNKIAKFEDKNLKLNDRIAKAQSKITKENLFLKTFSDISDTSVRKAIPAPVYNFMRLIARQKADKVQSLQSKIDKCENNILNNNNKIAKHKDRMITCSKINTFLHNMKSSEGRQENFVKGLQEFQAMSIDKTSNKLNIVDKKINTARSEYERTHFATEKIKLRDKLEKLENKKAKLEDKLNGLYAMGKNISAVEETTEQTADVIISKSYDGIVNAATSDPDKFAKSQVDTVLDVCNEVIDGELSGHEHKKDNVVNKESENYLKNAEMSVEDDYDSIDGIINNGSKEGELKRIQQTPNKEKPSEDKQQATQSARKKAVLSRERVKKSAAEIAKKPHKAEKAQAKTKGQSL